MKFAVYPGLDVDRLREANPALNITYREGWITISAVKARRLGRPRLEYRCPICRTHAPSMTHVRRYWCKWPGTRAEWWCPDCVRGPA